MRDGIFNYTDFHRMQKSDFFQNVFFFPEAGHGSYLLADFCEQLISKAGSVQLLSDNWALFVSFERAGGV